MPLPPPKPIGDKEPQVTALFRDVLGKLMRGASDAETFTEDARKEWFPGRAKEFQKMRDNVGEVKSIELVGRAQEGGRRSYTYRVNFVDRPFTFNIKLTADNKVAELNLE